MSYLLGVIIVIIAWVIYFTICWLKTKQVKDIVVNINENELASLVNDTRDFNTIPGYHFHACLKRPNNRILKGKMYFEHDGRIMGYGLVNDITKIDDEQQTSVTGLLWRLKNKTIITWNKSEWYKTPIDYGSSIKHFAYKYFNLKKLLGDRKEPELIDIEEEVCKKKKTDLSIVKEKKK